MPAPTQTDEGGRALLIQFLDPDAEPLDPSVQEQIRDELYAGLLATDQGRTWLREAHGLRDNSTAKE